MIYAFVPSYVLDRMLQGAAHFNECPVSVNPDSIAKKHVVSPRSTSIRVVPRVIHSHSRCKSLADRGGILGHCEEPPSALLAILDASRRRSLMRYVSMKPILGTV